MSAAQQPGDWIRVLRRFRVIFASVVVGGAVLVACGQARASLFAAATPVCPATTTAPAGRPTELPASVDDMMSDPKCLRIFALSQPVGTNPQVQIDVPARNDCAVPTVVVAMTAMQKTGNVPIGEYNTKQGHVVARIDNLSECYIAGVEVPPYSSAIWIVERVNAGGGATKLQSRVISMTTWTDVTGSRRGFTVCPVGPTPLPGPTTDIALIKPEGMKCDHKLPTQLSVTAALDSLRKVRPGRPPDPPGVLWIACSQDCCYAEP